MGMSALARQDQVCVRLLLVTLPCHRLTNSRHVASLGAWLSLACLALGPFFQQAVSYDQQSATDTAKTATTTVAYIYNGARDSTKGGFPNGGVTIMIGGGPSKSTPKSLDATDAKSKRGGISDEDDKDDKFTKCESTFEISTKPCSRCCWLCSQKHTPFPAQPLFPLMSLSTTVQ